MHRWLNRNQPLSWLARLALLIAAALSCVPAPVQAEGEPLLIGVFPRRPSLQTQEMFQPLATELARQLERPVRLEVPADFPAFWQAVSAGRYHLVQYNPYHYVRSRKEFGYRVLAMNEEFGDTHIRAALWIRKDSGVQSAEDLKGRKVIFGGGRKAMISYIVATDLLRKAGLQDDDYISQFTVNPTHAMMAVYYRQGIAAGLNLNAPKQALLSAKIDFEEMRPLLVAPPLAMHPWAVASHVDARLEARIRAALLGLNDSAAGQEALAKADLTGLAAATDADYEPHREIIARVLNEQY